MKKSRVVKTIRNIAISVVVLLVVTVGAGAAYTWYAGRSAPVTDIVTSPVEATSSRPVIKHVPQAPGTKIGASVQTITSPVEPGSNTSITVKTTPGAICTISVLYNDVASKDSGLTSRVADEFGVVMWAWTVESSVPFGKWPVKVTCVMNEFSAVVQTDLVVALEE